MTFARLEPDVDLELLRPGGEVERGIGAHLAFGPVQPEGDLRVCPLLEAAPVDLDLVCFFDALHDMGNPLAAATSARRALREGGVLMAVEPKSADELEDNINPASRLFYAGSVFLCTPSALAQGGEALGAQAGPTAMIEILQKAGFESVRIAHETPFNYVFEAR